MRVVRIARGEREKLRRGLEPEEGMQRVRIAGVGRVLCVQDGYRRCLIEAVGSVR